MLGTDTLFRAASTGVELVGGAISLSLRLARLPFELVGGLAEGMRDGADGPPGPPSGADDSEREAREREAREREARERAATTVLERDELDLDAPTWEAEAARGDLEEELLSAAAGDDPPSPAEMREAGREAAEEDATVVGEYADPGAEDGPGAELHVAPPWEGYDNQTATEIRQSLADASPATAGAVQLYESTHRARASVLRAAERAIKGGGVRSNGR